MLTLTSLWASSTLLPMTTFSTSDIPDMTGRTTIITGANSGIGRAAAQALAGAGARVVLAVRDVDKGATAAAAMPSDTEVRRLDLANLASIHEFADAWSGDVDLLINNAGVMVPPLTRTADGFELQFGTNHLGHFALTNLLLDSVTGRVVTVSSTGHRVGAIDFNDLNWERKPYKAWRAYGQSKLANLLFTSELQRRLRDAGSPVLATAAHPGYAATNLQFHSRATVARPDQPDRQPVPGPGRARRRAPDAVRGGGRRPRRQLRRPRWVHAAARCAEARRAARKPPRTPAWRGTCGMCPRSSPACDFPLPGVAAAA